MATILVVEDGSTDREFLVALLGSAGHHVFSATDGPEGLASASLNRPDLIISDVLMPSVDAYEFVRRLRRMAGLEQTPVIFYTASYHEHEARALATHCGVTDLLTKPSEPETVLQTVDAVLSRRSRPRVIESTDSEPFNREHARLASGKLREKISGLETSEQRLAAVLDSCHRLATQHDPMDLLEQLCAVTRQMTLAQYAVVGMINDEGTVVTRMLTSGVDQEAEAAMAPPSLSAEPLRTVLLEPRVVRAISGTGRASFALPGHQPDMCSYLAAPIASPSRVYGWLAVHNKLGADAFSEADERVALILGVHAGIAYENARLVHDLRVHTSALYENEQRTKFALGAARMGVWELDLATDRITWSNTMGLVFGLAPDQAPATRQEFLSLIHPKDRQAVADSIGRAAQEAIDSAVEFRAILPDGRTRWIAGQARRFRATDSASQECAVGADATEYVSRIVGMNMDVTERKDAEEILEEGRQDQIRFQDEFLSHVSHELRSPLTVVKQFTTILLGGLAGDLNAEQRRYQEIVLKNVGELQSMIGDLLELTGLETGTLNVELEHVCASDAVRDTLKTLELTARAKGVTLSFVLTSDLPLVRADPMRLRQILITLVENAIKSSADGDAVDIHVLVLPRDPRFLLLEVSDSGCGISPEMIEKIFERLYRPSELDQTARNGLGIGLHICRKWVMRQGGEIWVRSKPEGSTFSFTLPVFSQAAAVM